MGLRERNEAVPQRQRARSPGMRTDEALSLPTRPQPFVIMVNPIVSSAWTLVAGKHGIVVYGTGVPQSHQDMSQSHEDGHGAPRSVRPVHAVTPDCGRPPSTADVRGAEDHSSQHAQLLSGDDRVLCQPLPVLLYHPLARVPRAVDLSVRRGGSVGCDAQ